MTCFMIFFGLAVCAFEELMVYSVCNTFLQRRLSGKYQDFLAIAGFTLFLLVINQLHHPLLNVTATVLTAFCIALLIFTGGARERLYCCSLTCLVLFATEYVGFRILGGDLSARSFLSTIIATVLIKLSAFIILQMICSGSKNKKVRFAGPQKIIGCFFLYPLSCFVLLLGLRYSKISAPPRTVGEFVLITGLLMLLFSNMLLFFLYDYVVTISGQIHEHELSQAKDHLTQQHFSIIQETNRKYTSLLHDVNNYIRTIQNIQLQEDSRQIQHISESLMAEISGIGSQTFCSSPIINAILHEKYQEALGAQIDFHIFVEPCFPEPQISDHDLISLLCNLIDNAEEAAVQCEHPYVNIQLFVNGAYQVIKVRNPYRNDLIYSQKHFFTSKPNPEKHGFGIRRVEAITKKYNGSFSCTPGSDEFTAVALLPLDIPC